MGIEERLAIMAGLAEQIRHHAQEIPGFASATVYTFGTVYLTLKNAASLLQDYAPFTSAPFRASDGTLCRVTTVRVGDAHVTDVTELPEEGVQSK